MGQVTIFDKAIPFGFKAFFENFLVVISSAVITLLGWLIGLIVSALIAAPCFIPASDIFKKLASIFDGLKSVGYDKETTMQALHLFLSKMGTFLYNFIRQAPFYFILSVLGVIIFAILFWFVISMFMAGWMNLTLEAVDTGSSKFASLFINPKKVIRIGFAIVLYGVIVGFPWLLYFIFYLVFQSKIFDIIVLPPVFIISFYLQLRLIFAQWFVLDKNIGIFKGIKRSYHLKGGLLNYLLFYILMGIISFGLFLFIAGIGKITGVFVFGFLFLIARFIMAIAPIFGMAFLYRGLESQ